MTRDVIKKSLLAIKKTLPHEIQTKLHNINKASSKCLLSTKRVSQSSRILIPFRIVHTNQLSIAHLQTHVGGMVIELPFKEYLRIYTINEEDRSELEQYCMSHIGSDEVVSSVVTLVKEDGQSSVGSEEEELYKKFKEEETRQQWTPLARNGAVPYTNKGNDKWMGHYYIDMSGGSTKNNETMPPSHTPAVAQTIQIFTNWHGFMTNDDVIMDVQVSLYYQLLFVKGVTEYLTEEKRLEYITLFTTYLQHTMYLGESIYEKINRVMKRDRDGYLCSPITLQVIPISYFMDGVTMQISHDEAVSKERVYVDEAKTIMLSDYRPGNLFWDTKYGNQKQQTLTYQEYEKEADEEFYRRHPELSPL